MILPIVTYNDAVLREDTHEIDTLTPEVTALISSMIETMYHASGVGLAAPQIGESLRLFVLDADAMLEDEDPEEWKIGPTAFINPKIIDFSTDKVTMDEGCLSLPGLREPVVRPESLTIRFRDTDFAERELTVGGWLARVIQHEYDHLFGTLFFDHLGSFRKRLLKGRLDAIADGRVETDYPLVAKD